MLLNEMKFVTIIQMIKLKFVINVTIGKNYTMIIVLYNAL